MTIATTPARPAMAINQAQFETLANGLLAASILRETLTKDIYVMAPVRSGYRISFFWRKPACQDLNALKIDDGWLQDNVADEAAFRAEVEDVAADLAARAALNRRELVVTRHSTLIPASTPWGPVQSATLYADGVMAVSTAGHGGIILSEEMNAKVHAAWRPPSSTYEEDEQWAIVAVSFPDLFTAREQRFAQKTVKDSYPRQYEKVFGTKLTAAESHTLAEEEFFAKHGNDFIVTSALNSDHHPGMVEVYARRGGWRGSSGEERRYLIPQSEYNIGRFGFVIDESRHSINNGPFTF
jgi:hypothetical protein